MTTPLDQPETVARSASPPSGVRHPAVRPILLAGGLLLALLAPHLVYPIFLMKILCFALFACAFNLLIGFAGLMSFGHAAFFGGAAYVCAHAAKVWGLGPEAAILAATAYAALMGAIIGVLAIRRQGIYFAMITLALAQMIYFLALQLPFTHGEDGIQAVPRGLLFGVVDLDHTLSMYHFVLAIFVAGYAAIHRIVRSPFGHVLEATRENEARAISLGYRTELYRLTAFVLSAMFAGLAGATKALVFQLASLTDITWQMSGEVVLMTLLGGMGTLFGPVAGAALVVALETWLASTELSVPMVLGGIFVTCVLAFRRGIVGEVVALMKRRA